MIREHASVENHFNRRCWQCIFNYIVDIVPEIASLYKAW